MQQAKLYVILAIKKRKTIYIGHMMRRNAIQRALVDGQVEGRRCRGRPRAEWTRNVYDWTESTSYVEMVRKKQDRRCWRSMTVNLLDKEDILMMMTLVYPQLGSHSLNTCRM